MYIYLDESYNLKDRNKKQFVSINGFMAADVKTTNILLELADFYSNIFYGLYQESDDSFLKDLRPRIYQLKNPLSPTDDLE